MNFFRKRKKQTTVVTIHGFGTKASKEMDPISSFLRNLGYKVIQFNIYNPSDLSDCDPTCWIKRCEQQMNQVIAQGENVVLLGFSMGGVIASYLASIFPVKGLILVAPAFQYLDFSKIQKAGFQLFKSSSSSSSGTLSTTTDQKKCFMSIISSYKNCISQVEAPVLFLHGTKDEIISPKSSKRAYLKVPHDKKRLVYIEGGKHRMLYDHQVESLCFSIIQAMLQDEIMKESQSSH